MGRGDAAARAQARRAGAADPLLHQDEALTLGVFCDVVMAQDREPKIPVLNMVDAKLSLVSSTASATPTCPTTARPGGGWRWGSTPPRAEHGADDFAGASEDVQTQVVDALAKGKLHGEVWDELAARQDLEGRLARDPERVLLASLGVERDRVRRPGLSARVRPAGCRAARELGGCAGVRARSRQGHRAARSAGNVSRRHELRTLRAARCGRPTTTPRSCSTSTAARSRASGWRATTTRSRSTW